jgi:biopolymer transport protein ExbB
MLEGKSIIELINMAGFEMYALIFCSILSVAVIINRVIYFIRKSKIKRAEFTSHIKKFIENDEIEKAIKFCQSKDSLYSNIGTEALKIYSNTKSTSGISEALDREVTVEIINLEKYTGIVGTIGNISVYIGLLGTVMGIMKAFHNISVAGSGGIDVVIGGVSQALIATAAGLSIAIPAVVAYNYFVKKIDYFTSEMEVFSSQLLDLLGGKK